MRTMDLFISWLFDAMCFLLGVYKCNCKTANLVHIIAAK